MSTRVTRRGHSNGGLVPALTIAALTLTASAASAQTASAGMYVCSYGAIVRGPVGASPGSLVGQWMNRSSGAGSDTVLKQTAFIPYYGKNAIHYDRFDWRIYTTDHFEIYYYPELERHLERVAGYA